MRSFSSVTRIITTASQSGGKIIGDTTTGRKLKGQSKKHTQTVQSQY